MKCFYHGSDFDGHCSGAIVKLKHPECEMYPFEYGEEPPWDEFNEGEEIFIVDASFDGPTMEEMLKKDKLDITWIDHHQTAIDEINNVPDLAEQLKGVQSTERAACELTWEYLHPGEPMPEVIRLIGRYDVWDHSDPLTLPFQYGMRVFDTDPADEGALGMWELLFEGDQEKRVQKIAGFGRSIMLYQFRLNKELVKSMSFDLDFEGLRWIAVNLPARLGGSKLFEGAYDPERHDAMMSFVLGSDKSWYFSLRSEKEDVDVGSIAMIYGGGGHKHAAGFKVDMPPFRL